MTRFEKVGILAIVFLMMLLLGLVAVGVSLPVIRSSPTLVPTILIPIGADALVPLTAQTPTPPGAPVQ